MAQHTYQHSCPLFPGARGEGGSAVVCNIGLSRRFMSSWSHGYHWCYGCSMRRKLQVTRFSGAAVWLLEARVLVCGIGAPLSGLLNAKSAVNPSTAVLWR